MAKFLDKLLGKKESGSDVEVILTKKLDNKNYIARVKERNPHSGLKLTFDNNSAIITKQDYDLFELQFEKEIKEEDLQLLTPPYIKEKIKEEDYQTIYAQKSGSLAAPTAGLHFTEELLNKIKQKGVKIAKIRLDISYTTFLPIRDNTGKEYFELDQENANLINSGKIVAVGTTVVKCLESCLWENQKVLPTEGYSELFIKPGHQFKAPLKAMLTNFHLPKSSLLLLTSAFTGRERLLQAYQEAIKKRYRFYSLGDAMFIKKLT